MPKGMGRGRGRPKGSCLQKKVKESANVLEVVRVDTGFEEVQEADTGMQEKMGRGRPKRSRVQKRVLSDVVEHSSGCKESEETGSFSLKTRHVSELSNPSQREPQTQDASDIEAHLLELRSPLPSELRNVLLSFLASHPTMLLSTNPLHRGPAYMLLGEFLLFVGRHSLGALAGSQRDEFLSLLNALSDFSFDSSWLERIRGQVISSSEDSPFQALSRVSASKEYVQAKVEQLSAEAVHLAKALEENDRALQEHLNEVKALEEEESHLRSFLDTPLFKL